VKIRRGRGLGWAWGCAAEGERVRRESGEAFGIRHWALGIRASTAEIRSCLAPACPPRQQGKRLRRGGRSRIANGESRIGGEERSARSSLQPAAARKRLRRGRRDVVGGRCQRVARCCASLHAAPPDHTTRSRWGLERRTRRGPPDNRRPRQMQNRPGGDHPPPDHPRPRQRHEGLAGAAGGGGGAGGGGRCGKDSTPSVWPGVLRGDVRCDGCRCGVGVM
jgi:hypothetical protein